MPRWSLAVLLLTALTANGAAAQTGPHDIATAVWTDPEGLGPPLEEASAVPFEDLYAALEAGPRYQPATSGILVRSRVDDRGVEFRYAVLIPPGYDPARRYPVYVVLHGGIRRPLPEAGDTWWGRAEQNPDSGRIAVFPLGWDEATWWGPYQAANLAAISRELRAEFNVDENRFFLAGISDGGSGVYFHAFRASTLWAGFLAYIGHPAVLNNPQADTDGDLFVTNLTNRPFFVVSGDNDRLYPSAVVAPYVEHFRAAGVEVVFRPQRGGGHDMRWLPGERDAIRAFIQDHPRDPLPDRIRWETDRTDRYQRHHWLEITALGPVPGESPLRSREVFAVADGSGRVDVVRRGNRFEAWTRGVRRFRLLLSPAEVDLSAPVVVVTNGMVVFEGMVDPDPATLVTMAARDRDRTMLFAAALDVEVAGAP